MHRCAVIAESIGDLRMSMAMNGAEAILRARLWPVSEVISPAYLC
jgi:uncharacterized protein YjfI (DUF2170 family)